MNSLLRAVALAAALLGGCATPSLSQLHHDTHDLRAARSALSSPAPLDTVAAPLDADGAARLALLQHPASRLLFAQLQLAQADLYEALRPGGPTLDLARLTTPDGLVHTAWSVSQPLLDLLFAGYRRRHGELAMREAQSAVADGLLRLERDARQAWLAHAAAAQRLEVARSAAEAAQLAAELAGRYRDAGNISELQWRAEQAAAHEAALQRATRETQWLQARNALLDALGIADAAEVPQFVTALPAPVPLVVDAAQLAVHARQQRLDLAADRAALERATLALRQQRRWRWLPQADLRYAREAESGAPPQRGPGITLGLPFPDTGAGRVTRAEADLARREATLQQRQLSLGNRIAAQVASLSVAYASVEQDAAALRAINQRIVELAGQQYNFMFIGSFELLAARRRQIEGELHYIDATERWWRIHQDLAYEAGGRLPAPAGAATEATP